MSEPRHVDGNVLGGAVSEVCAGCRSVSALRVLDVSLDAPGAVGRCRSCGAVPLRRVRGETRTWLDLTGIRALEIPTLAKNRQ